MLLKRVYTVIIMLFTIDMYRLIFIPRSVLTVLSIGVLAAMIATVILVWIYDRTTKIKHNFNFEVGLIFLSSVTAMIGAYIFHDQSMGLTAWAQRDIYIYFFYFFLHAIRFKVEDLEKIVFAFGIVYLFFFFLQFAAYPRLIFDIRAEASRGTIRFFLKGGAFAMLAYFMALDRFFKTNQIKYSIYIVFFFLTIILQATRQSIGVITLGTIVFFIFSKQVKSKLILSLFIALGVIAFFWIFQDFINGLIAITTNQVTESQEKDDIRIRAATFFLTEFFPSPLAYVTGNGVSHLASAYGVEVFSYKMTYHYYQSDVGIIGDFSCYGAIFLLGVISIYRKVFSLKHLKRFSFIKYFFFISLLKVFLFSDFAYPEAIINISIMFYMIDIELYDRNKLAAMNVKNKNNEFNVIANDKSHNYISNI